MREIGNHILAVIGIFGLLSIPLVIDSCNEKDEVIAYNTSTADVDDTEVNEDNFTFEVDSIRLENRADTYAEESSEDLEESNELVVNLEDSEEVSDEYEEEDSSEPIVIAADSFNDAFKVARVHLGPGKQWVWDANGITYTTFYAEEKAKYDSLQATYWTEEELTSGTDIVEVKVSEQY